MAAADEFACQMRRDEAEEGDGSGDGDGDGGEDDGQRQEQVALRTHADAEGRRFLVAKGQEVEGFAGKERQRQQQGKDGHGNLDEDPGAVPEAAGKPDHRGVEVLRPGEQQVVGDGGVERGEGDANQRHLQRPGIFAGERQQDGKGGGGAQTGGEWQCPQRQVTDEGEGEDGGEARAVVDAEDVGRGERVVDDALDDGAGEGERRADVDGEDGARQAVLPDVKVAREETVPDFGGRQGFGAEGERAIEGEDDERAEDEELAFGVVHVSLRRLASRTKQGAPMMASTAPAGSCAGWARWMASTSAALSSSAPSRALIGTARRKS